MCVCSGVRPLSSTDHSPQLPKQQVREEHFLYCMSAHKSCPALLFSCDFKALKETSAAVLCAPAPLSQRTPESSSKWIQLFLTTQTALCFPTEAARAFFRAVICPRWWRTAGLCPRRWTSAACSSCARCRSRWCACWRSPWSSASSF